MRTTLIIEDALLRQAKRRAAERNRTVSDVVNQALREAFARRPAQTPPFEMITYGNPARMVRHEPRDFKAILKEEDLARLR